MIKLIVSDLDGTLLLGHRTIRPEDRQALHDAIGRGVDVAFASGRMRPEIAKVMETVGITAHCISQNGAYVHAAGGELIRHHAFERELIVELSQAAAGLPFLTLLAGPDRYMTERWSEHAQRLAPRLMAPFEAVEGLRERLGRDLVCGKISFMGDVGRLREFQQTLLARYGEAVDAYISDIDCLDVMPKGSSKGSGLLALLEKLNIRPEETACFGDAFNDLSMFAVTPHSFAMASSHPDVQARASCTVPYISEAVRWIDGYNAGAVASAGNR
ncbi:HAD family hydrolase [Paenibacillus sp. A3]|uniref:Cof-type HAD-IIB family hydrolase n=1 Tax=Paenibacillus sp. A3 TaxID=1337054 RepID=UPI0006D59C45|nr:Cof-type HAD-IIB family hydrolase [Paenibacillus sp. A3]KPV57272.1 HAD family hydrolase [Paenibacillus sp. A3]